MFKKVLYSPYRFIYHGKFRWIFALLIFALTFYITYYMRAHEVFVPEHKMSFFWICMIHSLIPTLLFVIVTAWIEFGLRANEKWRLIFEFFLILGLLILIGLSNFFVRDLIYDNDHNWSLEILLEELINAFSSGLLIGIIVVFSGYFIQLKNQVKYASEQTTKSPDLENTDLIQIHSKVKKETFYLYPSNFLYAKSDGNYTEIFLIEDTEVTKLVKRITLSDFKKQMASRAEIFKVHKSFLVNLHFVQSVAGNSSGLKLTMQGLIDFQIPVSRNNVTAFQTSREQIGA